MRHDFDRFRNVTTISTRIRELTTAGISDGSNDVILSVSFEGQTNPAHIDRVLLSVSHIGNLWIYRDMKPLEVIIISDDQKTTFRATELYAAVATDGRMDEMASLSISGDQFFKMATANSLGIEVGLTRFEKIDPFRLRLLAYVLGFGAAPEVR